MTMEIFNKINKKFTEILTLLRKEQNTESIIDTVLNFDKPFSHDESKFGEKIEKLIQEDNLLNSNIEYKDNEHDTEKYLDKSDIQSEITLEIESATLDIHEIKSLNPEQVFEISNQPKTMPTLLNNKEFVKIVEECVDIMNEFETYMNRLQSEEAKIMGELVIKRLQELLERSGLDRIDDITTPFSILLHTPIPLVPVQEGEPIIKILQPGLILENRVFLKAKIQL